MYIYDETKLRAVKIPTKQWSTARLRDAFASGMQYLEGQNPEEQRNVPVAARVRVVLGYDEELLYELGGTTEAKRASGYVRYYPPNGATEDHLTDALRSCVVGIHRLPQIAQSSETPAWLKEVGWIGDHRGKWKPPWES